MEPGGGKSFLKWAGGKTNLVDRIASFIPEDYNQGTYWEPFLGSGALFFKLKPKRAVLSDVNVHLIRCFEAVRDNPRAVHLYLQKHKKAHSSQHFYRVREQYKKCRCSVAQAARFIYLNKSCFNGLFRVNQKGEFNVPYGRREKPALPTCQDLAAASQGLENVKLLTLSFDTVMVMAQAQDFVYLDPPYTVLRNYNGFVKYNAKLFSWGDQERLRDLVNLLTRRNVRVLQSNAAHESIRRLYRGYRIIPITRTSCISASINSRRKVTELLISNYF